MPFTGDCGTALGDGWVLETLQQGAPECCWAEICMAAVFAGAIIGQQRIWADCAGTPIQVATANNGTEKITRARSAAANLRLRDIM
jgi:hypothetical protein